MFYVISKLLSKIRGKVSSGSKKCLKSEWRLAQAPAIDPHARTPCSRLEQGDMSSNQVTIGGQ